MQESFDVWWSSGDGQRGGPSPNALWRLLRRVVGLSDVIVAVLAAALHTLRAADPASAPVVDFRGPSLEGPGRHDPPAGCLPERVILLALSRFAARVRAPRYQLVLEHRGEYVYAILVFVQRGEELLEGVGKRGRTDDAGGRARVVVMRVP